MAVGLSVSEEKYVTDSNRSSTEVIEWDAPLSITARISLLSVAVAISKVGVCVCGEYVVEWMR